MNNTTSRSFEKRISDVSTKSSKKQGNFQDRLARKKRSRRRLRSVEGMRAPKQPKTCCICIKEGDRWLAASNSVAKRRRTGRFSVLRRNQYNATCSEPASSKFVKKNKQGKCVEIHFHFSHPWWMCRHAVHRRHKADCSPEKFAHFALDHDRHALQVRSTAIQHNACISHDNNNQPIFGGR